MMFTENDLSERMTDAIRFVRNEIAAHDYGMFAYDRALDLAGKEVKS